MMKIKNVFLGLAAAAFLCMAGPSFAQNTFENQLYLLNQTEITFSPRFKTDQDIFAMRVLDPSRQLIGKIEDMRVDENGGLVKLVSEINRVGRHENIVQNDAYEVTFHEDISAFEIPLVLSPEDRKQDDSPEALAAIAPAAGGGHLYSMKAMIGAEVRNDGGRWLGVVKNVVFDEKAEMIEALVLEDVPGARRYTHIALPYDPREVKIIDNYGRVQFRVAPSAAKAVTDFAKARR